MTEGPKDQASVDQPEPDEALPDPPPPREHERKLSDADDRGVELDEPDTPDPPVDDDDRDPEGGDRA